MPEPGVRDSRHVQGLDALELQPRHGTDKSSAAELAGRIWAATWPKVTAAVLVLLAWQALVWSGWRSEFVLPGPDRGLPTRFHQVSTPEFWNAVPVTMPS